MAAFAVIVHPGNEGLVPLVESVLETPRANIARAVEKGRPVVIFTLLGKDHFPAVMKFRQLLREIPRAGGNLTLYQGRDDEPFDPEWWTEITVDGALQMMDNYEDSLDTEVATGETMMDEDEFVDDDFK
jgi:hypothetical protein